MGADRTMWRSPRSSTTAGRSRCPPTASSTASCPGSRSTSGCSSSPRTTTLPLLERAKFLAIFASNLDEFFMVRVAGLKRRIATGIAVRAASGCMPREVLEAIWQRSPRAAWPGTPRCFRDDVAARRWPSEGIELLRWDELDRRRSRPSRATSSTTQVFPVLTPLAVDPAHPFPYISGLSLNLAVVVRNPVDRHRALRPGQGAADPAALRRASADQRFVPLEDVIAAHLDDAVPGHGGAPAPHLPGHPQRGRRGRGGRRREPAPGAGARAACGAASARRCASRSRRRSTRTCSTCWSASSASPSSEVVRAARARSTSPA